MSKVLLLPAPHQVFTCARHRINSPYCRLSLRAWLDNLTKEDFVSDYFTIKLSDPYDLYAFLVEEARVGLD